MNVTEAALTLGGAPSPPPPPLPGFVNVSFHVPVPTTPVSEVESVVGTLYFPYARYAPGAAV